MYSNTYIWNLEKWYWRTNLQGSNGETDIEYSYLFCAVQYGLKGRNLNIPRHNDINQAVFIYFKKMENWCLESNWKINDIEENEDTSKERRITNCWAKDGKSSSKKTGEVLKNLFTGQK